MKRVSFIGNLRYLGVLLIAMQGILLALLALLVLNDAYMEHWKTYGHSADSMTVYLDGVSEEKRYELETYLYQKAEKNHLFLIRRETSLAEDGSFAGYTFGVYGDVEKNEVSLSFYDKTVLDRNMLSELMQSEESEATLGIDKGSAYSLRDIPQIHFGDRIVLKKLQTLIEESGTIQGEYTIVGVDESRNREILADLAGICKTSEETLLTSMKGEETDSGFKKAVVIVFILAQMILNAVFFIIITLQNLDKGGKLALLGWSRGAFCYELFGCFLWYAVIAVPVLTIVGIVWSGWTKFSISYVGFFFLYAVLNMILTAVEIGISVAIQMSISPLSAIMGRFPKKALYFLGILAYLGVSAGIVYCGLYVDSTMHMISENARLSERWKAVSDYQVLRNVSVGNDESSFAGASLDFDQSMFDWYREIHKEDGVYLIQTTSYDDEVLELWRKNEVYTAVPKEAFWYFAFSETYIRELGIRVSDEVLKAAEDGVRVYLIPSHMSEKNKEEVQAWLEESAVKGIREGDIETVFNAEREIKFVEYEYGEEFFTWSADSAEESVCGMPVIYICTPENMTYFESESLRATGMNGYIKFKNRETAERCLDSGFLERFRLNDNQLTFLSVEAYIDGLQKELKSTIAWFGLAFLILAAILSGILVALAAVFRIANQEKLNVQKFLGYGFWDMYKKPMLMLLIVMAAEIIAMLSGGSKFGLLGMLLVAVVQIVIFVKYMTKNEISNIHLAFKER